MVQDFGFTKSLMIEHIHDPCDHGCIMDILDPTAVHTLGPGYGLLSSLVAKRGWHATEGGDWPWGKLYLVPFTPTAENLARHWHDRLLEPISKRSGGRAYLKQIVVWETPNHSAAYPAL
jgi:6-pyruvoyltetrahydropterin/6-carboxytetrahydropterin synthase